MMTAFVFILPAMLLSGHLLAIESMPRPAQILTYAIPALFRPHRARHPSEGQWLGYSMAGTADLSLSGLALLTISSLRFKKRLE